MAFNEAMDVKHSMAREYSMGQTNEDVDPTSWGVEEVGTWLGSIGLGQYGPAFAKHQVTGEILHMLSEELIKELGVATIGHRVKIAKECLALHKSNENRLRFKVHWEADQIMYEGGCTDWLCKQLMCVPCCDDPDHYKLTGAILYLTSEDRKRSKGYCSGLCQTSRATRAVDLSTIAGVSDYHINSVCDCGCAADVISVELNGELGLDPVRPILVKKGQGYKVSAMITRAARPRRPRAMAAPGTDAAPRRSRRPIVLIKFAIEELAPAKAALSDGLTHEEAVVLKEKTGTMYCFQIPMTLLNLYNQSLKAEAYDKAVEDARAKELEDAPKKED
ncbi:kinase regulator Ste50 [Aureococcus anophagefferens]|nr:kinase regulator Ste50 [Aureococcus anophagefferens]